MYVNWSNNDAKKNPKKLTSALNNSTMSQIDLFENY